jgi:hypothetical protein
MDLRNMGVNTYFCSIANTQQAFPNRVEYHPIPQAAKLVACFALVGGYFIHNRGI